MNKKNKTMQKEKIEFRPWSELRAELRRDPKFRKAYADLEFEFQLIRAIIDARVKGGLTQAKLAAKMGTKQSAIARFESGMGNPTLSFLKKLSSALNVRLMLK